MKLSLSALTKSTVGIAIASTLLLTQGCESQVKSRETPASASTVADSNPHLGEKGHLVMLKHSSPLTEADYIHAHAMKNTPAGEVHFITSFPQPGKYKLWGQFNRNGKIVTSDFWVDVQEPS